MLVGMFTSVIYYEVAARWLIYWWSFTHAIHTIQQTRDVHPMLVQRWTSVADGGSTLY